MFGGWNYLMYLFIMLLTCLECLIWCYLYFGNFRIIEIFLLVLLFILDGFADKKISK